MTHTSNNQASTVTSLIITHLTPIFLTAADGDPLQAQTAALETVNAYTARHPSDLFLIAESIALGLGVLSSISLSMTENIPINLILRLRGNAASLHRAADQCRRALADVETATEEAPRADIDPEAEAEIIAEVARTTQRVADFKASFTPSQPAPPAPPPQAAPAAAKPAMPALQAGSERRIAQAAVKTSCPPISATRPGSAPMTEDDYFRAAWSSAMTDVANEMVTEIAHLPQSERRAARIRIGALSTTANHLIIGQPPA